MLARRQRVAWTHINSHVGHPGNELAHDVVGASAAEPLTAFDERHLAVLRYSPQRAWEWLLDDTSGRAVACPAIVGGSLAVDGAEQVADVPPVKEVAQGPLKARDGAGKVCTYNSNSFHAED